MTILSFDQIHALGLERRSLPIEQYFGEMVGLTRQQKRERIELAEEFSEMMRTTFDAIILMAQYGAINWSVVRSDLVDRYRRTLQMRDMPVDGAMEDYINDFADHFVETTQKHVDEEVINFALVGWIANEVSEDVPTSDAYYLSEDRVILIGESESNTDSNYSDYDEAVREGKTSKTWHTMLDNRVRETHRPLEGVTLPIQSFFVVGDSLMLYPRDIDHAFDNPEEICGCRCAVTYS